MGLRSCELLLNISSHKSTRNQPSSPRRVPTRLMSARSEHETLTAWAPMQNVTTPMRTRRYVSLIIGSWFTSQKTRSGRVRCLPICNDKPHNFKAKLTHPDPHPLTSFARHHYPIHITSRQCKYPSHPHPHPHPHPILLVPSNLIPMTATPIHQFPISYV